SGSKRSLERALIPKRLETGVSLLGGTLAIGRIRFFNKPVARVTVVIDPVPLLQVLDMRQCSLGMRTGYTVFRKHFETVQEDFFKHFSDCHVLVKRQVTHQGGQALFNPPLEEYPLDFEFRFAHGDTMTETYDMLVRITNMDFANPPRFVL